MSKPFRRLLCLSLTTLWALPSFAEGVIEGRVVRVIDGDTIEVLTGATRTRVRLSGIDTPERGQPWATRSKRALIERVGGKEVRVIAVDIDRFGRTVGEVYADDQCVGCELVRDGHAWVYRKYTDDPVLLELEDEARAAKRGLWGLGESQRIPPWEWRHGSRQEPTSPAESHRRPRSDFECGVADTCRAMESCEEARFHFEECGLTRLDGDGDGVPCEQLCSGR